MYFYISFLRPPPVQAQLGKPVPITPQISNDLRTELYSGTLDIFYSWISGSTSTCPLKLTTWRESSAYREVSVPQPPGVKEGDSWQLALAAGGSLGPASIAIDLSGANPGATPFAVRSMPVCFVAKRPSEKKQEQTERIFQLFRPSKEQVTSFVLREQISYELDKKVWDSGIGLSSWLVGIYQTPSQCTEALGDILFSPEPKRILELGAGTGISALTLSVLCPNHWILCTDCSSAMGLLGHNLQANSHLAGKVASSVLDWDSSLPPEVVSQSPFHLVMMADVTYNTVSFPALIKTLVALIDVNTQFQVGPPLILMAHKLRDQQERSFLELAHNVGISFDRVAGQVGYGGAPVELWLGHVDL